MSSAGYEDAATDPRVDQAKRLFDFLARAQELKSSPPQSVEAYNRNGSVLWLADAPEHPAVTTAYRSPDPEPEQPVLTVDRIPRVEPPDPEQPLSAWLNGPLDDPATAPELRASVTEFMPDTDDTDGEGSDIAVAREVPVEERPEIREEFDRWLPRWQEWAEQELLDRPVRDLYAALFSTYVNATSHPEELELIVATGCLGWIPTGHPPVKRHLLSCKAAIHFDDDTGRLTVIRIESIESLDVELDMLAPSLVSNTAHINEVREQARQFAAHPLHQAEIAPLVRRLVHSLDADGQYRETDAQPDPSGRALATFAPAVILRKRSQQGLVEIFRTVVRQLSAAGMVPDGVLPLIDPNHTPRVEGEPGDGALVTVDDDPFLPLPVNEVQLRVLRQVDTTAQTLVQGPPGTGKTHMAAALLSHLLAQGKRVLVTAHTDRALKEVRQKLPERIKPLSVAVVGTSREDMSDLKLAVDRIATAAAEHDPHEAAATLHECLDLIDQYRRRRAELYRQLVAAREHEVIEHEHAGYRGTLTAIARQRQEQADRFGWLACYVDDAATGPAPVHGAELVEWHGYLTDGTLRADEPESRKRLLDLSTVPDPQTFADLVTSAQSAESADRQHGEPSSPAAFDAIRRLDTAGRDRLRRRLHDLADEAADLARRRESWLNDALADVRSGRAGTWQAREGTIHELIERARTPVNQLGSLADVGMTGEAGPLVALAEELRAHLDGGGTIRTNPDGSPKIGLLTAKQVKQAQPLFDQVRVDGLAPTTAERISTFLLWVDATRILAALEKAWPDGMHIAAEDTLPERLQWHVTEAQQLRRVLALGERLEQEEQHLATAGLPRPDWNDLEAVREYAGLVDAAAARDARAAAIEPLHQIDQTAAEAARWDNAAGCVHHLLDAVRRRDHNDYAVAHQRIGRLAEVQRLCLRRNKLAATISAAVPALGKAVTETADDPRWPERLADFADAWAWATTGAWIRRQGGQDINELQAAVNRAEEQIRRHVEELSATRAWSHAVAPERLTGQARADLEQYAQLVRRLGKGTGVYAAQRRAEIRHAMDRCRPAVPVWIMPIYRIAEQLRIQPDMFDVVIVDEASQAGLEALFLQYLAPKIVVIGDDKQVSPSAVGIDQQQLRDLARQYLADDRYLASWQDPQRSLFDHAKMLYGGRLTLVEHRRCVPEIIGFSNQVAYEPDGIRLIPVRQYGADRLEPVKAVFLADGYQRGTKNKVNRVEVEAIVTQIEKCIADPRYDGRTFGVISLLGTAQAKVIETELLSRVPPEEWAARNLRCGDSADFQGSERDVMFLSMVAAPEPEHRMAALTRDTYVQRYNVAASRARDQMWVFHSVTRDDLGNKEDMRFRLLDYCYGVINRREREEEGTSTGLVPEHTLVEPFDSLFEQRVYNRLVERGYWVVPQYPVEGYRIDLVVIGAQARLAVECDGDAWHGPDAYERDLARQRDLERCGWQFFRIRESAFYIDQPAMLEDLRGMLHGLDIHPPGHDVVEAQVEAMPEAAPVPAPAEHAATTPTVDAAPATTGRISLGPYEEYTGAVPSAIEASRADLMTAIQAIVAREGPVVGDRLHRAYVSASGGSKVGSRIAKALNAAVSGAVRRGIIVQDAPLDEVGVKPRTYRLPDQPEVRLRQLGPRSLDQLPPRELAALFQLVATQNGNADEEALYRAVLDLLGRERLTPNVRQQFRRVLPLLERDPH